MDTVGEGIIGEEDGKRIVDNWRDYHGIVMEKYRRRIERFRQIVRENKPIIVLCRHNIENVLWLQVCFEKYYHLTNVFFVNSCEEVFENDRILNIFTEKNGEWNDSEIWREGVDSAISKILASVF